MPLPSSPTFKEAKLSHFSAGAWKVWEPEGMLVASFLIMEGNRARQECLVQGHTAITHQLFLLPEGRL